MPGRVVFLKSQYEHDLLGRFVLVRPHCQTYGRVIQEAYAYSTVTSWKRKLRHVGCAEQVGLLQPSLFQRLKAIGAQLKVVL